MNFRRRLVVIMCLFFATTAQAEVYRWVDSQGKVQYSDQLPLGVNAQKITSKPAAGGQPAATAKGYQEQEQEFRKRRVEQDEQVKKQAENDQQTKTKQQNCAQAKAQLAALQSGGRFARTNEKSEREYLDEKGTEATIADTSKAVADWCK